MKRLLLLVGALFLLISCTTEFDQLMNGSRSDKARQTTVFQASTEGPAAPETKVYADENMKVLWNEGDQISIFNLTTLNTQWAFTGEDGDTAGGFEEVQSGGFFTGNPLNYVYAAYPYSKSNKISNEGVLTIILPAEQNYKEKSFGIGANTMVAITDGSFLAFKNVGGYLSLRLYGDDISVSKITIKGNNGEKIAGKASIDIPFGGTPTVTMDGTATDEVSIVCDPAVKIGTDANSYTDFWFVIPPVTFEKGFTITVTDDKGGVFERATSKALTVNRNTLEWMNPLEVVPNYEQGLSGAENLSESETANCYIVEKEGVYSFIATTIGNGNKGIMAGYHFHTTDASISPVAAKLLWQDHEVVSNIKLQNGRVFFNASSEKGNAVIAVTDASGTILWSWHIWATDRPNEIRLTETTHAYLDRNLGATSVQIGKESSKGLYYQWGRKDPIRAQDVVVVETPYPLLIEDLIQSPSSLFYSEDKHWIDYPSALWGNPDGPASTATVKTIYDPCPKGYTIPSDDTWYEYDEEFHSRFDYLNYTHKYYSLYDPTIEISYSSDGTIASKNGMSINYPLCGGLLGTELVNSSCYFKNCQRDAQHSSALYFVPASYDNGAQVDHHFSAYNSTYSVSATPIRCIKEEKMTAFSPSVSTNEASSISVNNLVLNGVIEDTGNSPIKKYGFVWGNSQNALDNEILSSDAHQQGFYQQFDYKLDNLPPHSVVYYRAFAENTAGRDYGNLMIARLKTATEYAQIVLDSLSIFMSKQYSDYGQGFNGEGTIRLFYGDYPGNSLSVNLPGWSNVINSGYLADASSKFTSYPLFYYYRIINKVNSTIDDYLPLADDADPNINHYKAALLGFRAYAYTMLVQLYCKSWDSSGSESYSGLPLRINAADNVTSISTLGEVYSQIYNDLDIAIDLMKNSVVSRSYVHEIDLRTLYAIYAKAALNRKDYVKALDYAQLARADHSLMSNNDYNAGFNTSNPEWIWGAHNRNNWQEFTLYYYAFYSYMGYNASSSAAKNSPKCINKELFDRIPTSDVRRKLFLDPTGYSYNASTGEASSDLSNYGYNYAQADGRQGLYYNAKVYAYMQFKFANTFQPGGGQQNFIRAAEMVLIEAEANYFLGNENETRNLLVYLNKQSERNKDYQCSKSGAELFDELKFYRRLELWGEGFDWFDTKRWEDPISRQSFAQGGNYIEELSGIWGASDKNDFVWVLPSDYEQYVRTGSGL